MRMIRLIKHDLLQGTVRNIYKFLIVFFVVVSQMYVFHNTINSAMSDGIISSKGTFFDYILYVTKGMNCYTFSPNNQFEIPIYWFCFQIGIAYIIAYYPERDYSLYGKQMLLTSKSRIGWWISKCIWCIVNVALYFILAIGAVMLISSFLGVKSSFDLTYEVVTKVLRSNLLYVSEKEAWLIAIILPCVTTMAISMCQVLLSFVLTPVLSFALVCAVYVLSAYYTSTFFIGNYTMWLRSDYIDIEGVNPEIGLLMSLTLLVGSIFVGCIYFDKKDIM